MNLLNCYPSFIFWNTSCAVSDKTHKGWKKAHTTSFPSAFTYDNAQRLVFSCRKCYIAVSLNMGRANFPNISAFYILEYLFLLFCTSIFCNLLLFPLDGFYILSRLHWISSRSSSSFSDCLYSYRTPYFESLKLWSSGESLFAITCSLISFEGNILTLILSSPIFSVFSIAPPANPASLIIAAKKEIIIIPMVKIAVFLIMLDELLHYNLSLKEYLLYHYSQN